MASYAPRAAFVNFAFIDPRPDDDVGELARALHAWWGQGNEQLLGAAFARASMTTS